VTASEEAARPGRRVVGTVFVAIVAIAGLMGFILGIVNPEGLNPTLFGVIDLPPTPLGMVIFGVVTIGVGLGVLLLAVSFVADRFDEY
jgi:uncharacterized integral membrane protein